eukprot:365428-Chlamydomonas_euryale.AAC.8
MHGKCAALSETPRSASDAQPAACCGMLRAVKGCCSADGPPDQRVPDQRMPDDRTGGGRKRGQAF